MSKADEMFEKLGYEKIDKTTLKNIIFVTNINETTRTFIKFNKIFHKFETYLYDSRDKEYMTKVISMKELQAINEKCKELGWLDE